MVFVQFSYISPSKCKCSSPSGNLMSCSFLISRLYSLSCFSYGDVICGTSCLCSLNYLSCGDVMCGTSVFYLATCTTVSTAHTTIGTIDGSTPPLIIFYALTFVLSCSLFTLEPKVPPFSTLLFVLRIFLGESIIAFFLYSSVVLHIFLSYLNLG
jgi:hypothetical protein